ncbi:MAG: four helix bundle protein [Ignavibacteria bacterium]|nr:four helix bundle protein [Ignavibacteria bacterium]MCC7158469.1 four helix bundle protein [Ignavibacteria bacterium]
MLKLNHKKLIAWEKSLNLVREVYKLTKRLPKEEQYVLIPQLRRAAVSVASNIAEGASRKSTNERKRFYQISRSSAVEVDTQIEICLLLEYCKQNEFAELDAELNNVFALLTAMINNTK